MAQETFFCFSFFSFFLFFFFLLTGIFKIFMFWCCPPWRWETSGWFWVGKLESFLPQTCSWWKLSLPDFSYQSILNQVEWLTTAGEEGRWLFIVASGYI